MSCCISVCQNCVRWSPDGESLVAAGDSPALHMYSVRVNEHIGTVSMDDTYTLCGHRMMVLHVEFSRDGHYLASCSLDGTVIVRDTDALGGAPLVVLDGKRAGHKECVTGVAWDPADRYLVTQSADGTIKFWRTESWTCERTVAAHFDKV